MEKRDWNEVAELICVSTNTYYNRIGKPDIFPAGPASTIAFCEIYESLDPGCCVVAEDEAAHRLLGSCFYHPRETHVSLGIMNVHPDCFAQGVARTLLKHITDIADRERKPVRLVSSAMNLDSYSLYTRAGFVPRRAFQDMVLPKPVSPPSNFRIRDAVIEDVRAMADLEHELGHIRREKDYRFFLENRGNIWHSSVVEDADGTLDGFLVSIHHPACNMLGPGIARTQAQAAALIFAERNRYTAANPVFLVPVDCADLVHTLYQHGARNCELHFAQIRGDYTPTAAPVLPTFMPESG